MICITESQLRASFAEWEQDFRDGKCLSHEETAKQTVQEVAENSAANMMRLLAKHGGKQKIE